jgi:hypothetical protein
MPGTPATKGERENSDVGYTFLNLFAMMDNGAAGNGTSVVEVIDPSVLTPEPSTLILLASSLSGIAALARARRRPW